MNALDVGTVLALLGVIFKVNQDKAAAAEEVGRAPPQLLPQQQPIRQVEAAAARKAVGAAAPASGRRRPNRAPKKVGRSARRLLDHKLDRLEVEW